MRELIGKFGSGMLVVFGLTGCTMETGDDEENLGTRTEAFNANQCATASPVATFSGQYTWNSPTTYGTACNAVDETTGGSSLYLGYYSTIASGGIPTNKAHCEATYSRSVFYTKSGSTWVVQKDTTDWGVWESQPVTGNMICNTGGGFFPPPGGGTDVRVATTARRIVGSSFVTLPITAGLMLKPL